MGKAIDGLFELASRMEELHNNDNKIHEKLNMNAKQFNESLEKYRNISAQIQSEQDAIQAANNPQESVPSRVDFAPEQGTTAGTTGTSGTDAEHTAHG